MNNRLKTLVAMFGCLLASPAIAAPLDFMADGKWTANIEGGGWSTGRTSTDSSITYSEFSGGYLAGSLGRSFGAWQFTLDGRGEWMDDKDVDDVYESGPVHTGIVGLHFGRNFQNDHGKTYVGIFTARGFFDGHDSESWMKGETHGIEAEHYFANNDYSVFGQFGYMTAVGDPDDNEFKGYTQRIGLNNQLSEKLSGSISIEHGSSPDCFEDCNSFIGQGNWGSYLGATLQADYALTDNIELIGRLSHLAIRANSEDDGTDTSAYLGVRFALGGRQRNNHATSLTGVKAAGWMETLD